MLAAVLAVQQAQWPCAWQLLEKCHPNLDKLNQQALLEFTVALELCKDERAAGMVPGVLSMLQPDLLTQAQLVRLAWAAAALGSTDKQFVAKLAAACIRKVDYFSQAELADLSWSINSKWHALHSPELSKLSQAIRGRVEVRGFHRS